MYLDSLMLRLLQEASEYLDYNPSKSRDIIRRVMGYLEDRVNGETQSGEDKWTDY